MPTTEMATATATRPDERPATERAAGRVPGGRPVPGHADSALEPNDEEVTEAIILASRALVGIAMRSLAGNADDVTLPQYRTLVVLACGGPRRLADLAEALGVSPSTATRMCDRLVRKELVSRTRDELDRREVKLAITAAGRRIVADVTHRRRDEVSDLLGAIPVPLRRQLVSSLTLLAAAAGEGPELHWAPGWS
ncbi:MAG: MarR family transcriptional regulator [Acidimicrobiales bacterium]